MRERSDTVPVQLTDTFGEYWTMNSAIPTLHRLSGASTDNEYVAIGEFTLQPDSTADGAAHEYVDMDEGNVLQQMTPSSTTEGARNTAEGEWKYVWCLLSHLHVCRLVLCRLVSFCVC